LILSKIIKTVVTRCQIVSPKCTKLYFGWGSTPDPAEGAHSAPPDLVDGFKGSTSKRRGGKENEGRGKGRGEEGERGGGGGGTGRGEERGRVRRRKGEERKERREGRRGEGRGSEGNRGEGRRDGGGKRREEKRAREKVYNLRKTTLPSSDGWERACVCSKFLEGG